MIHLALFIPKEKLENTPEHELSFQTMLISKNSP